MSVNENACGSPDGVVTSSTRIRPRFAWVKVQVTTSPGASATADGEEPSLQVAETSSQPAGSGLCVAAYVPGRTVADW